MERVGSSAMNSLAAYADSDEEEEKQSGDSGDEYDSAQRLDFGNRHRTLSTAEIAKAQLPEAPDSYGEDEASGEAKRHDDDDDDDAEFRRIPLISDDFDDDHDSPRLVEPPPPARPRAFNSTSPSSSRGSTPQITKLQRTSAMPRTASKQALVSYGAEDDDEFHQRHSLENDDQDSSVPKRSKLEEVDRLNKKQTNREGSHPASDQSHKSVKSEATTDEIDVDELLEKPLEGGASSRLINAGSPGDGIVIDSIQIPPPPQEKCSEELQGIFRQFLQKKRRDGYNINAVIQARTDFRNPSIYEKLIEHFGIDEAGTNFAKDVYDPHGFKPSDYYEEIGKAQRIMMEKFEKGPEKDVKPKPPTIAAAPAPDDKKRKSKWDN